MKKSNKNKRFGLIALVIVLIVIVGVGYAASTDDVVLNGNVSAVASDLDIEWATTTSVSCITTPKKSSYKDITATGAYTDVDNATMTVTKFKNKGDKAACTYTIKNASDDLNANITCSVTADVSDATHYNTPTITMATGSDNVAVGGTTTATVEVSLKKSYKADQTTPVTYTITCTGASVEES